MSLMHGRLLVSGVRLSEREGRGSGLQRSNSVWDRGGSVSEGRVSMKDGDISVREMMNIGSSQLASAS